MMEYKNYRELVDAWFQDMAVDRCPGKLWKGKLMRVSNSDSVTTSTHQLLLPQSQPAGMLWSRHKLPHLLGQAPSSTKPSSSFSTNAQRICCSSLSCAQLFATSWTAAHQASLSITNSWSLLRLMAMESVMLSNHLIFSCPLLLLPSALCSIKVFTMGQFFTSGSQNAVISASESVLPMNIQGLFPWGLTYIFSRWLSDRESTHQCRRRRFNSCIRKILRRRK